MARGFESKSVADQQEAAQAKPKRREADGEPDPAIALKRRRLELARIDVLHHLDLARADAHKEMLRRALAALDKDLGDLGQ